jgi:two-component SAPR family response regulator
MTTIVEFIDNNVKYKGQKITYNGVIGYIWEKRELIQDSYILTGIYHIREEANKQEIMAAFN